MDINPNSPVTVGCFTVITLEAVIGIFMNVFIIFVALKNGFIEKNIHSGDSIRASMARSSIVLAVVLISSFFCSIFFFKVYNTLIVLFNVLTIYSISSSLYVTAIFCFFLYIKIVQIKSSVLALLKRKITVVFPRLVATVEVFSFCCSFLSFVFFTVGGEVYTNSSKVSAAHVIEGKSQVHQMSFLILAVFLVPYFLMAMTTILAVGSIILHSRKMKVMKITGAVNTEAYKSTVCKMMGFLIIHTLFCSILFLAYFSSHTYQGPGFWTVSIIIFFLSPAKSLILIYSNTQLRNNWKMMIGCIFCSK